MSECCNLPMIPGECWYDHFERFLGPAFAHWEFSPNTPGPTIQILAYDRVFDDALVFCSLGFSHYQPEVGMCAEIYLPADDGIEQIPYVLASALFFMVQEKIKVGIGANISNLDVFDCKFVADFHKDTLYLTSPQGVPDEFREVRCGGFVGSIVQAAFISPQERSFLRANGSSEFESILEEKGVDLVDIKRPSVI